MPTPTRSPDALAPASRRVPGAAATPERASVGASPLAQSLARRALPEGSRHPGRSR